MRDAATQEPLDEVDAQQAPSSTELPLLDRAAIRAPLSAACEGAPDSTPLPVDPRSLVVEGINGTKDRALHFNAFFVDLHDPPAPYLKKVRARPKTCGEFRASVEVGRGMIQRGNLINPLMSAAEFVDLWKSWGYAERPADFDAQVAKRYGLAPSPISNPYPLAGEDPNTTGGGSGQLPAGLLQGTTDDGSWDGQIRITCSLCHDARLGSLEESPFSYGRGNNAVDLGLFASDLTAVKGSMPMPITASFGRGTNSAIAGLTDLVMNMFDMDTLEPSPSLAEAFLNDAASGFTKAPAWWNRAFRTRQFWDGALSSDNVRSEMAFVVAAQDRTGAQKRATAAELSAPSQN